MELPVTWWGQIFISYENLHPWLPGRALEKICNGTVLGGKMFSIRVGFIYFKIRNHNLLSKVFFVYWIWIIYFKTIKNEQICGQNPLKKTGWPRIPDKWRITNPLVCKNINVEYLLIVLLLNLHGLRNISRNDFSMSSIMRDVT